MKNTSNQYNQIGKKKSHICVSTFRSLKLRFASGTKRITIGPGWTPKLALHLPLIPQTWTTWAAIEILKHGIKRKPVIVPAESSLSGRTPTPPTPNSLIHPPVLGQAWANRRASANWRHNRTSRNSFPLFSAYLQLSHFGVN